MFLMLIWLAAIPRLVAICACNDLSSAAPSGSARSSSAVNLLSARAEVLPSDDMYADESDSLSDEPSPVLARVPDSRHLLPFMQGDDAHSFTSVAQLNPTKPFGQEHAYLPKATGFVRIREEESVQTPVFMHGSEVHSLMSITQLTPVKPTAHLHEYPSILAEHVPP